MSAAADTGPRDEIAETVTMSGGQAIAEMLNRYEVGPMFGMGGFQLLPFYDAAQRLGLAHHLTSDERCAAFAVDAYARVTGRPGVCDATLGPGATNLVTGLVESLNAGVPLVVLTGDANRQHAGKNMTQETNQTEILRPAVKELLRVEDPSRIPELVRRAFSVACSGRPGPVVLDVPEDVTHAEVTLATSDLWAEPAAMRAPARRTRPASEDVERAAEMLARAKRPVLLAGGGIHLSGAYDALQQLLDVNAMPVAHTMSGKGSVGCDDPWSVGLFGRYSRIANELVKESDCLIAVGCKLGEVATERFALLPEGVPLIQLDVLAEEFHRSASPGLALWGDAREGLVDLAAALDGDRDPREDYRREVQTRHQQWLDGAQERLHSDEQPINVARLVGELNQVLPPEALLVADGGFAAHWTALLYDTKQAGRGYVANRGFASIGYGLPGAIGAQLAAPDRPVVGLTGDGGFNMTLGEIETALRVKTPVTLVVVNNAASGYVKALQHHMFEGRYQSSDLVEMDYAAIANAMGCGGIRVTDPAELAGAIRTGIEDRDRPTVIDVIVTRDPGKMLPAADRRTVQIKKGDRIA